MKKRPNSNLAESPKLSILGSARSKMAVLALSCLSVAGCKVCFSFSTNSAENAAIEKARMQETAREAAVDDDGNRTIHITEADAIIDLQRVDVDTCRSKIIGLMDVYKGSPLHSTSNVVREFETPGGSGPWSKLVIEPPVKAEKKDDSDDKKEEDEGDKKAKVEEAGSKITDVCGEEVGRQGRITLRTKDNAIAMVFKCGEIKPDGLTFCQGEEIDPAEFEPKSASEKAEEKEEKVDACNKEKGSKTRGWPAPGKKEGDEKKDEKKEDESKKEEKAAENEPLPTEFPRVFVGNHKIEEVFRPALAAKLAGDPGYLKSLGRELAGEHWKIPMEKLISEIENGDKKVEDIIGPIVFLLGKNPNKIRDKAQELGVVIPDGVLEESEG